MKQTRTLMAALRAEVAELRGALDTVHSSCDNSNTIASLEEEVQQFKAQPPCEREANVAQPWRQVVRKGKGKCKGKGKGVYLITRQLNIHECPNVHNSGPSHALHTTKKHVSVENSRKILRSTSTTTVMNAIQQTTPSSLGKNLTIKRKFRNTQSGGTKWWFVIKGNKYHIDFLEKEWSSVALQTVWKLQSHLCF